MEHVGNSGSTETETPEQVVHGGCGCPTNRAEVDV